MVNETPEEKPVDSTNPAPEPTPEPPASAEDAAPVEPPAPSPEGASAEGEPTPETVPPAEGETAAPAEDGAAPSESALPELTLGTSTAVAEQEAVEEAPAPNIRGKIDKFGVAIGTGRRKTSVARVRIKDGDGKLMINGRSLEEYLRLERDRNLVEAPLHATNTYGSVDVWVRVQGGGTTGQTGAIILGIARALEAMNPSLHHTLSEGGYLTRDDRMVERKKYGFKKARKSFQFSKR